MKITTIPTTLEAEQYLEDSTNWHAMHYLVSAENAYEDMDNPADRKLIITYDLRDFELEFGDWVVRYPDGTLHFFAKETFDRMYHSPFADPITAEEIEELSGIQK